MLGSGSGLRREWARFSVGLEVGEGEGTYKNDSEVLAEGLNVEFEVEWSRFI